jgi:hypothetical protein
MANHRRKRRRKQVRCSLCTPNRNGNAGSRGDLSAGTAGKVAYQAMKQNADAIGQAE